MSRSKVLFWNVDTQVDFVEPHGKLYVQGAEKLKSIWAKITNFAAEHKIRVINTCDFHHINSHEIPSAPDFKSSFPLHCIAGTSGASFIEETRPASPVTIDWDMQLAIFAEFDDPVKYRNIIIRKDDFDVFAGNPHTEKILSIASPDKVFVYGVTTNVCVDKAVKGLVTRGYNVYVIHDAIKELPGLPLPFDEWNTLGVKMIPFNQIDENINK